MFELNSINHSIFVYQNDLWAHYYSLLWSSLQKNALFIGKYESSFREFLEIDLIGEINDKNDGCFMFNKLEVITIPTMVDYLRYGLNLNMITAIDFTNANIFNKINLKWIDIWIFLQTLHILIQFCFTSLHFKRSESAGWFTNNA